MTQKDINHLCKFILRVAMYTGKQNQDCIVSYLHGYEDAIGDQCNFIKLLSDSIYRDYNIKSSSTNWIGQIDEVADKSNTDWIAAFKRESLKILVPRLDESSKREFQDSFKKRLIGKIASIDNNFARDWIIEWFGLCDISVSWFKEMWTQKELALMRDIELELREYESLNLIQGMIQLRDKLRLICKDLLSEINNSPHSA